MISRRHFLRIGAHSAAVLGGGASLLHLGRMTALAQGSSDYRSLVCVFLHGGNDGNNMIAPLGSRYASYASARAGLALPQAQLLPISTPTGEVYGLHPQLKGLQQLFQQRRLAVVANVGTLVRPTTRDEYLLHTAPLPRNLYSHLDQQMAWQTAVPEGRSATGWGGRTADRVAALQSGSYPTAVSVAGNALFTTGASSVPATIIPATPPGLWGIDGGAWSNARQQSFEELLTLDAGAVLVRTASETTREGLRQSALLSAALATRGTPTTPFPDTDIGRQLAEIAKVINVRQELGVARQIFFCSLTGFDNHVGQLVDQDNLLGQLDKALVAFNLATIEMAVDQQVTTFTQSEFGRTLQPTSGTGSDHAWGNHHLVMGGAVRGGSIHGRFPDVTLGGPDDVGKRGVWLPTSSLDQYGAALASWFGVQGGDMPLIFPNINNFSTQLAFLNA